VRTGRKAYKEGRVNNWVKKVSEEAKEKEENKESTDWFKPLLAPGVKGENGSEWYLFSVELDEYSGDKTALIKGQEERAISILKEVAQREFPGLEYQVDEHAAFWERKLYIDAATKMRESEMPFMDDQESNKLYIYNDATLQKFARQALNDLVFNPDP